ncbi:hypothetical protein BDB00DRAFT_802783 [Zychaea mexicana]|uniref:uncharacterized protein n=1 Tax=Zychaea mexicana TaxID=64656 RepID=UPI0022FE515C|nr:uncharacterized protein BDB00DRAFT_802783 [Zychaea mexicana]KAI9497963.1 hypothetical protein BDB00DRAFT_802783 [Zychaea mexicana]
MSRRNSIVRISFIRLANFLTKFNKDRIYAIVLKKQVAQDRDLYLTAHGSGVNAGVFLVVKVRLTKNLGYTSLENIKTSTATTVREGNRSLWFYVLSFDLVRQRGSINTFSENARQMALKFVGYGKACSSSMLAPVAVVDDYQITQPLTKETAARGKSKVKVSPRQRVFLLGNPPFIFVIHH